jgi:cob(I)alamin adenosyltransferase
MGELATANEDRERYLRDGLPVLTPAMTSKLDHWVKAIEERQITFHGWATPGQNTHSAALDMARTICRRAERRVCELKNKGQLQNSEILIYLNRLSDLLWLLARQAEAQPRQ